MSSFNDLIYKAMQKDISDSLGCGSYETDKIVAKYAVDVAEQLMEMYYDNIDYILQNYKHLSKVEKIEVVL